jgi:hypothetical protein
MATRERQHPFSRQCRRHATYIRRITNAAVAPIATTAAMTASAVMMSSSGSIRFLCPQRTT